MIALVGLQAAQDVGPHQIAQRPMRIMGAGGQLLGEIGELLCRAQQRRIDEVEKRPEVGETVFDRRAGQRNPGARLELLTALVCLAPGFLIACASSRIARRHDVSLSQGSRSHRAIGGDDEIDVSQTLMSEAPSIRRRASPKYGR